MPGKIKLKNKKQHMIRLKLIQNNSGIRLVLSCMMALLLTSSRLHAQEASTQKQQDTAKAMLVSHTSNLYDQILSDPRNRKHLELSKQGWIGGPGANTFLRFGGFVQVNFIGDFQNTGYKYGEFIPSGIPIPTEETKSGAFDIRTTRITFETRTDTKKGVVNTFIEMDFNGETESGAIVPRLRQAYVAWLNTSKRQSVLIGQATTTLTDGNTWPESFDLEGPNAMLYLRQIMVRYTVVLSKSDAWSASIALEEPQSEIQNGEGLEKLPDLIFALNWKEKWGNLRFGFLSRQLVAESDSGTGEASTFGYGMAFSGQLKVPYRNDNFQFQFGGGRGTGRYLQDLGSAPEGQDGYYNEVLESLTALEAFGGFIAYQHWWSDVVRTNVTGGYVNVNNLEIQGEDALNTTIYVMANTFYSPFKRFDIGLEYYYGQNKNKVQNTGHANRLMLGVKYSY
jgi:hypothetical protein